MLESGSGLGRRNSLIVIHLPFEQHSKVFVRRGVKAMDAILPILRKRDIIPDLCSICSEPDPKSPEIDLQMDLEDLSQNLAQNELWVHAEYKDWEIPHHRLEFAEQIGKGSFGTVWKAKALYFGVVAVKKLNLTTPTQELLLAFKNEVTVLKKARHGNVLMFLGVIREPALAIVTQWCQGSSLYRHIHVLEPQVEFEMQRILEITKQIAQGMSYLHSKQVIHRDLKSNNVRGQATQIFLDEGTVKIGDFGLATVKSRSNTLSSGLPNSEPTGSILWMAPEVIKMQPGTDPYTTLSDVYSFGVCLYELLAGQLPYKEMGRDQILFLVGIGALRPNVSAIRGDCPPQLHILFEQCVAYAPTERPEFTKIYEMLDKIGEINE